MLTPILLAAAVSMPAATLSAGPSPLWISLRAHADTIDTWSVSAGVKKPGRSYVRRMWREGAGRDARWCIEAVWRDSSGAVETRQYSEANARTLAPIHLATTSPNDSCDVRVADGQMSGFVTPARKPRRELAGPLAPGAFAHEFDSDVIGAQPLRKGWRVVLTDLEPYRDGDVVFTRVARVVGRERIEFARGTADCWRVELPEPRGMTRTLWIEVRSHRLVHESGRPANGAFEWHHQVRTR